MVVLSSPDAMSETLSHTFSFHFETAECDFNMHSTILFVTEFETHHMNWLQ